MNSASRVDAAVIVIARERSDRSNLTSNGNTDRRGIQIASLRPKERDFARNDGGRAVIVIARERSDRSNLNSNGNTDRRGIQIASLRSQ